MVCRGRIAATGLVGREVYFNAFLYECNRSSGRQRGATVAQQFSRPCGFVREMVGFLLVVSMLSTR